MYAKCNKFEEAIKVFNKNINEYATNKYENNCDEDGLLHLYSSMMDCYSKKGDSKQALSLFNDVKNDKKLEADDRIYCIAMNACSHAGLVDDALSIFDDVKNKYNPQIITHLIGCLKRKRGHYLDQAKNLYATYLEPNINLDYKMKTHSLLSLFLSCRIHNDMFCCERIVNKINIISNVDGKNDNDVAARMYVIL